MSALLVILGAAVGAPLRFLTDRAIQARHDTVLPWGTFVVNIVASLILGVVTGAALVGATPHSVQLLVGVGLCGTLSTYSTFSYESLRLIEDGAYLYAVANVLGSAAAAVGAAFLGAALSQSLWS